MGAYFTMYFSGAFLGPIMAGNIGALHGWRSFFWLSTALACFSTIVLIFTFPETKYHRNTIHPGVDDASRLKTSNVQEKAFGSETASEVAHHDTQVGRGRPSKGQFGVAKPDSRWKTFILRDTITPVLAFFNPIVFWAGLMLAGPADLLLLFNLTESAFLGSPAYGWNPSQVGYSNFSFWVGGLVGVVTAGPFSDWLARRSTMKNNGVREAEMRLPALIPYVFFFFISHAVGAAGYTLLWPWQVILVCGYGFSGLAVTSIPTISIAYAIDCYKPISGEIMIIATIFKNVLGFCLSYWVFTVEAKNGWYGVFLTQLAISFAPVVCTIPLYYYGKRLRRWTRDSSFHRMEAMI